ILDDGRLTDGQGRTVDFRNTVLIMTSNLRSEDEMRAVFRPEFLNRIDEVVVFKPLTKEQLAEIVELQLERLRARLAERGLELEGVEEVGALARGRRAVNKEHELLVPLIPYLQGRQRLHRDHALGPDVNALRRIPQKHRERAGDDDEHFLLCVIGMPASARL